MENNKNEIDKYLIQAEIFDKTKHGKIFNIRYDVERYEKCSYRYDKLSHLASALSIATKGTKMETDSIELIKLICPNFFGDGK